MSEVWRRVALFYGLAFGWVSAVALVLLGTGSSLASPAASVAIAFLYMPAPLVAALITERVHGRRVLGSFEGMSWRRLPRVLVVATAATAAVYVATLALTLLLGNGLGVPGVGDLVLTSEGLRERLTSTLPEGQTPNAVPTPLLLYVVAFAAAMVAGVTVNGLFAFGEEYGWRGFLMDELRHLGVLRANLVTGVLWGLWHAPLILMGFNYGAYRVLGVLAMVAFTTALSFLLWHARERTGSVLAPAVIHGAINGTAGLFLFAIMGGDRLVAAPAGLVTATAAGAVAAGWMWWTPQRKAQPGTTETRRAA